MRNFGNFSEILPKKKTLVAPCLPDSIYYLNRLPEELICWWILSEFSSILTISCRSLYRVSIVLVSGLHAGVQSELGLSYFEMLHTKAVVARYSAAVSYDWINRAVAFARTPTLLALPVDCRCCYHSGLLLGFANGQK